MKQKVIRLNSKKSLSTAGPNSLKLFQSDVKVADNIEQTMDQIQTPRDFFTEEAKQVWIKDNQWEDNKSSIHSSPSINKIESNIVEGLFMDSDEKMVRQQ